MCARFPVQYTFVNTHGRIPELRIRVVHAILQYSDLIFCESNNGFPDYLIHTFYIVFKSFTFVHGSEWKMFSRDADECFFHIVELFLILRNLTLSHWERETSQASLLQFWSSVYVVRRKVRGARTSFRTNLLRVGPHAPDERLLLLSVL